MSSTTTADNVVASTKHGHTTTSGCLLPYIEGRQKEIASTKGVVNDFIPPDLLLSLKRFTGSDQTPPSKGNATLPPSRRNPTLPSNNKPSPVLVKRPDNMWNYPNRRRKFKHLTSNTPCVCGAGKDISFLYDSQVDGDDEDDDGFTKEDSSQSIPATLIPKEYHIVKHPGVMGLEFHDDSYSSRPANHDHHMTVFPSMKPSGRHEVLALKHTMDAMLERAGVSRMESDSDFRGPTNMHNLLELVKKEQDIYNIVFHELIRQVSVHCVERGELLAELRTRYSSLLDRIPRQVKDLHNEVIAQRALDRQLTGEMKRFKATIASLNKELAEVKEHDYAIAEMADNAQEELANALAESQRSSRTLSEYHELYELQRKRLEAQVAILNQERNVWQQSAYDLAYKVAEEHNLHSVRKLQLCEKSWVKLTTRFSLVLSSKETQQLNDVQYKVMMWRDKIMDFATALEDMEHKIKKKLQTVQQKLQNWITTFQNLTNEETGLFSAPSQSMVQQLWMDVQQFEEIFSKETEHFAGEILLAKQEIIKSLAELVEQWTDMAMKMFCRHQIDSTAEEFEMMRKINANIDQLLAEYGVRVSGENGIATSFLHLLTPMETWDTKLNTVLSSGKTLPDSDWFKLQILLEEWLDKVEDTIKLVGKPTPSNIKITDDTIRAIPAQELVKDVDKWKSTLTNSIDSQNAKLSEQILQTHMSLVHWMSNALLRLSQARRVDQGLSSNNNQGTDEETEMKLTDFITECAALTSSMDTFTRHLSICCEDIVVVSEDEESTGEQNDIKRMMKECEQWAKMANLLLQELGAVGLPTTNKQNAKKASEKKDEDKDDEDTTAKESTDVEEQTTQEASSSRQGVQLVGEDENVHLKPLEDMTSSDISPEVSPAKLELVEEDTIPSHSSVSYTDAEKLILQVDELEKTIEEQSKRVKDAEELAEDSKEQLKLAMERINELETELTDMKKTKERNTSGGKGKKSLSTRKSSRLAESPVKKKT